MLKNRFIYVCFLLIFPVFLWAQQFSGTGGAIPDAGNRICFPINVTGVGFINGTFGLAGVCLSINHTWTADLEIILKAPDGTEVPLSVQNGGSGANYTGTCFSPYASQPIELAATPFTGSFLPQGYMGNFNNGQNADGEWALCIRDVTANDVGALVDWSISFSNTPAPPRPVCLNGSSASVSCATAPSICNFNGLCGTTAQTGSAETWPQLTAAFCGGTIENNSFVKFIASAPTASFNVWVTNSLNALGIQMMIFEGNCGGNVVSKGCNSRIFPTSSGPTLVNASGLVPGNSYFIMLDGYLGDVCDYIIVAASGVNILTVTPAAPQLCPGESIVLRASGGNGNYSWSPVAGLSTSTGAFVTAKPDSTTTYTVTSNAVGLCPLVNTVKVTVNSKPELGTDENVSICSGSSFNLQNLFDTTGLSVSWTIGNQPIPDPAVVNASGIYQLIARNLNRCYDTAVVSLNIVTKPNLGIDRSMLICPGDSVSLENVFATGSFVTDWSVGGFELDNPGSVKRAGIYRLIAFNGSDCSDTAFVTIGLKVAPDLGEDKLVNLCAGTTVDVTSLFNTLGYSTSWTEAGIPASGLMAISPPAMLQLIATNSNGCTDTAVVNVMIVDSIKLGANRVVKICAGNALLLDTVFNTAGIIANWTFAGNPVLPTQPVVTPGLYQVAASNGSNCRDTALATLVIVQRPSLGNDVAVNACSGVPLNLNTLFPVASLDPAWYQNDSLVANAAGILQDGNYQVVAKDGNGCADTAFALVTVRPKPFIGNDVALNICPNITVNLNDYVNTTGYVAEWKRGNVVVANPTAITQPGTYQCIARNVFGCTDTAVVIVTILMKPNIGNDKSIPVCDGKPVNISAQFFTTGYSTSWSLNGAPVTGRPPIFVSTPGAYQLIVSNSFSCADTAVLTLFAANTTSLGPDKAASTCFGTPYNLYNSFDTTSLSAAWFYYGFRVVSPDSASLPGTYQLVASNASGCLDTAALVLTLNPKPVLGDDKSIGICAGTIFNLTAQFNTAGTTSEWTFAGLPVADPSAVTATGTYRLIVQNSSGCRDTAFLTLFISNLLNLGADTSISLCAGNTVDLLAIYPLSGLTSIWSIGNVAVIDPASVTTPGMYQLIATNGLGCNDTVFVSLQSRTNPSIGPDQTGLICQYNSFDLSGVFTGAGYTTNWFIGGSPVLDPVNVVAPGRYEVIATDIFGCTDTANLDLTITPNPFLGNDQGVALCGGDPVNLTTRFPTTGLTQQWFFHGVSALLPGTPVANPQNVNALGYYSLVAINSNGCRDTALLRIVPYPKPVLGPDTSTGFCPGATVNLTSFFGADYAGFSYAEWTLNGAAVPDPAAVNVPGIYRLRAAFLQSCYDTIFIAVNAYSKPSIGADRTSSICPGSSVGLDVQFPVAGLISSWTFGGQPVLDPSAITVAGLYQLIASNVNGCSDTATLNVVPLSGPMLGVDKKIIACSGKSTDLTAQYNTVGLNTAYTNAGVAVPDPADVTTAGTYRLVVSNVNGCSDTAFITISLLPKPALGPDRRDSICEGSSVNLFNLYDTTALVTNWTLSNTPVVDPEIVSTTGTYQLEVTNSFACRDTALYDLVVKVITYGSDSIVVCNNLLPLIWNGLPYSNPGDYSVTLRNAAGCDSIVKLHLLVTDTTTSETIIVQCNNQLPLRWHGNDYSMPGIYYAHLINAAGCDSLAKLQLIVTDTSASITNLSVCTNQLPYLWNGISCTITGMYNATLQNAAGCDSLAMLDLTVLDTSFSNNTIAICRNQLPYNWNGISCLAAGSYQAILLNALGCDSVVNLQLIVADTSFSNSPVTVCSNQLPYRWNGNDYAAAGIYRVRLLNIAGCDSVANLQLTVNDTSFSVQDVSICRNQLPYQWNGNAYLLSGTYTSNLLNAAGCDSLATLRLLVSDTTVSTTTINVCSNRFPLSWNGNSYTSPGQYLVGLTNAAGCDSIATLLLNRVDTSLSFDTVRICNNQLPYTWNGNVYAAAGNYQLLLVNAAGCDSIASLHLLVNDTSFSNTVTVVCSNQLPYIWNGSAYSAAGQYQVKLTNAAGCDSIAQLQLSVTDTSVSVQDISVCSNQLPFQWNGGAYMVAGTYLTRLLNAAGCDSLVTLRLSISDTSVSTTNITVCSNRFPFNWNGSSYALPGRYTVTLTNAAGCDSIATLLLNLADTSVSDDTIRICSNQIPFTWNGNLYTAAGNYQVLLVNAAGCDSVANLHLLVNDTSASTLSVSLCNNQLPYRWNGNNYTSSGTYVVTLQNAAGCDSVARLLLRILDTTVSDTYVTICNNQLPYSWNGGSYSTAGIYTYLTTNAAGCDSLAQLHLAVSLVTASTTIIDTCENSLPFVWNGITCTGAGTYNVVLRNAAGCDSNAVLQLRVKFNSSSTTPVSVCRNALPYTWNGVSYNNAGNFQQRLVNAAGCDSLATLQLTVRDTSESIARVKRCSNQLPYSWNGNNYSLSGTYQQLFVNHIGCDSTARLIFSVVDTSTSTTTTTVCSNRMPYTWNGNSYGVAGSYQVRLTNAAGCDSVAVLNLVVPATSSSTTVVDICPAQLPYTWNGNRYTAAGNYQVRLTNSVGCDSSALLQLTVKQNTSSITTVRVCENLLPYSWNGSNYSVAGRYSTKFFNTAGCDSNATLDLVVLRTSVGRVSKTICINDLPYTWNGNQYTAAGQYVVLLRNAAGCDSLVTLELTVNANPLTPMLGGDTLICPGDRLLLQPGNYYSYLWQNGSTAATFEVTRPANYSVRVGNEFGCYSNASVNIALLTNCDDIYFANAFSPNGDGKNETFGALGNLFVVSDFTLTIFNRLGKVMFTSRDPYQRWNGLFKGVAAAPGNYIWQASYRYRGKLSKGLSGNVVLLR